MPKFFVEVESHIYYEFDDIEAVDIEEAHEIAVDRANDLFMDEYLDWEIMHSEDISNESV